MHSKAGGLVAPAVDAPLGARIATCNAGVARPTTLTSSSRGSRWRSPCRGVARARAAPRFFEAAVPLRESRSRAAFARRTQGLGSIAARRSGAWSHEAGCAAGLCGEAARFAAARFAAGARFVAARGRFVAVFARGLVARFVAGRAWPSCIISLFGSVDFAGVGRRVAAFRFAVGRPRVAFASPAGAAFLALVVDLRAPARAREGAAGDGLRARRFAGAFEVVFFAPSVRAVFLDIMTWSPVIGATRRRWGRPSAIRVPRCTATASGSSRVDPLRPRSPGKTSLVCARRTARARPRARAACHACARLDGGEGARRAVHAQPARRPRRESALAALRAAR